MVKLAVAKALPQDAKEVVLSLAPTYASQKRMPAQPHFSAEAS
jgi:hypothetical protein